MRGRWIAVALAVLGVSAALLFVGLRKGADPVASAATKSEAADGANVALTVGVDSPKGTFSVSANGVIDQGQADITANLSQLLAAGGLPADNGSVELRYLQENGDPVVYVNAPALTSLIPGGKSWVRVDLEQAGKSAGVDLNQMLAQAAQNPADVLDMLKAAGSVKSLGTEPVGGAQTTHYQATIDLAKAAGMVGSPAQQAVQSLIDQGGPSTIPVDVWIGDDGFVHKLKVDETVGTGSDTATVHLDLGLNGYGTTNVNVAAPPSDDTLDATGLISMAAQNLQSGTSGTATIGG
jgi:hypothetical protein